MLVSYFKLQLIMFCRKLRGFGMNPVIGIMLLIAAFVGLSVYLFSKTEFAAHILALLALILVSKLSERTRNDFLKLSFNNRAYRKLRLIENSSAALPFIAVLCARQSFAAAVILMFLALLMATVSFRSNFHLTVPTPFYRKPFEFTVGFRKTWFLFLLAYFLTFMALSVSNFNLGILALLLIFLTILSFYSAPENEFYVWSFSDTPRGFLLRKVRTALWYATLSAAPIFVSLAVFFFNQIEMLLLFQSAGYIYLVAMVLGKYAAYPREMSLPQGIVLGISLMFPPILIVVIPMFYLQSVRRLSDILV
ncbi:MAG: hypothetical protein PHN94_03620 [Bacteroidales bacterium]|nr:hypothetical protein [Bacteroidales bacterium]